jgi:hypothetical protein
MIRRECLARAGRCCEDREVVSSEDYELRLRLARCGGRFLMLDTILGEYTVQRRGFSRNIRQQSEGEAEITAREFSLNPESSLTLSLQRRRRMEPPSISEQPGGFNGPGAILMLSCPWLNRCDPSSGRQASIPV